MTTHTPGLNGDPSITDDEHAANARLIAAAPEMLAFVCDMLSQYTKAADERYALGPQERIWTKRARALLAKIKGKE